MASTELVRPEEQAVRGLELAEQFFTAERRTAIARFLGIAAEEPALPAYLAVCASYGLDPIMGQVWLIETKAKDGDDKKMLRPAVGRDGYLAIARRDPSYVGLQSDVVCERDVFEVEWTGNVFTDPKVLHRHASKPTAFGQGEDPARWRGRVLGAWAKVLVRDRPAEWYFASLKEHGRFGVNQRGDGYWKGAWGYTSSMIRKAAQSYVLRIAFGITGLVPADELAAEPEGPLMHENGASAQEFDFDRLEVTGPVRERLEQLVATANTLQPMSWPPAKCEMVLLGRSEEDLLSIADDLEREVAAMEERAGAREAAGEAAGAGPAAEPVDAEVVPDSPADAAHEDEPQDAKAPESDHLAALRVRAEDLRQRLGMAQSDREHDELSDEFDRVEDELRRHAGEAPGQGTLE